MHITDVLKAIFSFSLLKQRNSTSAQLETKQRLVQISVEEAKKTLGHQFSLSESTDKSIDLQLRHHYISSTQYAPNTLK